MDTMSHEQMHLDFTCLGKHKKYQTKKYAGGKIIQEILHKQMQIQNTLGKILPKLKLI